MPTVNAGIPVLTAEEARAKDAAAARQGIDPAWLMEVAGAKAAMAIERVVPEGPVVVVVGPGHNGGDGLVVARYLARQRDTRVVLLRGVPHFPGADRLVAAARAYGAEILPESDLKAALASAAVVVDAVLGIGLAGPLREWAAQALTLMAGPGRFRVALDIVSGVDSDRGECWGPEGWAVDLTITFGALKWGHLCYPGAQAAGQLWVADIGLPAGPEGAGAWMRPPQWYRQALPVWAGDAHKYRRGRVVVIGGSRAMPGAPVLAAEAALRGGAGLVEVWVPEGLAARVRPSPALLVRPLPETAAGSLRLEGPAWEGVRRADAVVFGPGAGPGVPPALLRRLLAEARRVVVDGDGLSLLGVLGTLSVDAANKLVLTPHEGEMARLLGQPASAVRRDRRSAFLEAAARWPGTLVLKGPFSIVGTGSLQVVNPVGGSELATAGSGDVLSGLIGSLLAQGAPPLEAAALGAYLHGWCGVQARRKAGRAVTAPDLIAALPEAFAAVEAMSRPELYPEVG